MKMDSVFTPLLGKRILALIGLVFLSAFFGAGIALCIVFAAILIDREMEKNYEKKHNIPHKTEMRW